MIAIPIKIVESALSKFKTDIASFINKGKTNLENFRDDKRRKFTIPEKAYLNKLIKDFDKIVLAKPSELETFSPLFVLPNKKNKKRQKKFKDNILDMMGYSTIRSDFYPKYFQNIGIKSCVYCNSQLTVSIENILQLKTKLKSEFKAKFQVDHYFNKSDYPCFSISLFNLYPVCASCNNSKSKKKIDFKLYSETNRSLKSKFYFELDIASKAKFILSRDTDDIKIEFKPPFVPVGYDSYQDTFDIQGIYDTQIDVAEELILKAEIYTPSYKKALIKSFSKVFTNSSLSNRIIIGNYVEKDEMHKRPMSKFTQDIAEQVGLI